MVCFHLPQLNSIITQEYIELNLEETRRILWDSIGMK